MVTASWRCGATRLLSTDQSAPHVVEARSVVMHGLKQEDVNLAILHLLFNEWHDGLNREALSIASLQFFKIILQCFILILFGWKVFLPRAYIMYIYIYARLPTARWQSQLPSPIPSWMNELGTPYFGCSMIYVQ